MKSDHIQHIRSPFKFLDPYELEDGNIFFGRREEIEQLYQYVRKNRLVLVYGQSGTGKTSVVQCGLANRFEVTDWIPFFIRRGDNINTALRQALSKSMAIGGSEITDDTIQTTIERISARYIRPVYLIFDQFEELLILGTPAEQEQFITTIQRILTAEETQSCHLLFVLREEYFAWLDIFERRIPRFSDRRLRIERMRPGRLQDVIIRSCEALNITLEQPEGNARQIIESLSTKGGISLPYLQVYLDLIWREDFERTYPGQSWQNSPDSYPALTFTTQEISNIGAIRDVLDRFLVERTYAIQEQLFSSFPSIAPDTVQAVLDAFVSEKGTKQPLMFRQEEDLLLLEEQAPPYLRQLPPPVLTACLLALDNSRILRVQDNSYELAHDTLAQVISDQRSAADKALMETVRLVRERFNAYTKTETLLNRKELSLVDNFADQLKARQALETVEWNFIHKSKSALGRAKRLRIGLLIIAFLVLLAFTIFSWNQATIAGRERDKAEKAQDSLSVTLVALQEKRKQNAISEYLRFLETGRSKMTALKFGDAQIQFQEALNVFKNYYEDANDSLDFDQGGKQARNLLQESFEKSDKKGTYQQYMAAGKDHESGGDRFLVNALQQYRRAAELGIDDQAANEQISRLLKKLPQAFENFRTRGNNFMQVATENGYRQALDQFQQALRIRPDDPGVKRHIATCEAALEQGRQN